MRRLGTFYRDAAGGRRRVGHSILAHADSAAIMATDAGGGQMHVTAEVTSTTCSTYSYCGWFSFAVERHSSLPCREDTGFLMAVGDHDETSGTVRKEWTYEPFFPRYDKICVFIDNGAGTHPVGEAVISLPSGYGRQYSTAYNCSYFSSQERAEYYLELYPSDPSKLDADHDGQACESNPCPCGAEVIPAEPEPAPPAPPAPPVVTTPPVTVPVVPVTPPPSAECKAARSRVRMLASKIHHARSKVTITRQRRPKAARRWRAHLRQWLRERKREEEDVDRLCG